MKKTVILFLTAAILANTTVLADYYEHGLPAPFDGNSIAYEQYNSEELDNIINTVKTLIKKKGNEKEITAQLDNAYDEYLKAAYSSTVAQLTSDRFYDEENLSNTEKAANKAIDTAQRLADLMRDVYDSGYVEILENIIDEDEEGVKEYIETIPSEKYYRLCQKENEYISQFTKSYGNSGVSAELFIKMVALRNEIAREMGYDNYAEYANEVIYGRDYTAEEVEVFSDAVANEFPALRNTLSIVWNEMTEKYEGMTDGELISKVEDLMYSINGELGSSYRYMIDNNLYDIECRDGKNNSAGSYTVMLDGKRVPYLFLAETADSAWRVKSFIHECGHFCSMLNTPEMGDPWVEFLYEMSVDTCEVHSQGLEMLAINKYGRLFGADAANERLDEIILVLCSVLDGCYFNEWQTRVYEESDLTVEKANNIALELISKYYGTEEVSVEEVQRYWTEVPHNFVAPMYYISYAVSAAAVLDIYVQSLRDYSSAVDKYMQISALGGFTPFKYALDLAGLDDIFQRASVVNIAHRIGESFAISYIDVNYDDWYTPYLLETSHIADGRTENLFAPNSKITRAEFVKLIGKMYDYYVGIKGKYPLKFKDVDKKDDSAYYIMWANAAGIAEGYSSSEFGVNDPITREQAAAMLYRLYRLDHKENGNVAGIDEYKDASLVSDWAREAMSFMICAGMINGREDDCIDPQGTTTRAEAAKLAACYIDQMF